MADRRALITGITGQDGSYLAELLLEKGYEVSGMTRRASTENVERIGHLTDRISLIQGDLLDSHSLVSALRTAEPTEVYNLAAQSFVPTSWNQPVLTAEFTAVGVTRMLEAVRTVDPNIRFYQASSSEMFGKVREVPQTEHDAVLPALAVRRREGRTGITSRSTTASRTASSPSPGSSSTTSRPGAGSSS